MVSVNLRVRHKAFGDGVVKSVEGKYFVVSFAAAEKKFVYPDVFERYLTLADGTISDEILADLKVVKDQKESIRNAKDAENRYAMEHGIVIPSKEPQPENNEEDEGSSSAETDADLR